MKKINDQVTAQVQIWRMSELRLLSTVSLPPDSNGKHNQWPAEPRLLPDGSVYLNTFSCGLFRMKDVNGARPSAELVYAFPGGDSEHTMCSVPVVIGHYWIQTVAALPGLIALDVSHPEKPVEVSRLTFSPQFPMPHWLAADRKGSRLVVTGDGESWVLLARFDPDKGALSLDQTFRKPGATVLGISFDRRTGLTGRVAGRLSTARCSGHSDLPHPTFEFGQSALTPGLLANPYLTGLWKGCRRSRHEIVCSHFSRQVHNSGSKVNK